MGLDFCPFHKTNISMDMIGKALKTFLKAYVSDVNQRHRQKVEAVNSLKKEKRKLQLCRKTAILTRNK